MQKYRSLAIDHDYFHSLPTETDWQSVWRPARDLPVPLLPRCHAAGVLHGTTQVKQDALACTNHLAPRSLQRSLRGQTSKATSVDNMPGPAVNPAGGGTMTGMHKILAACAAGAITVITLIAQ